MSLPTIGSISQFSRWCRSSHCSENSHRGRADRKGKACLPDPHTGTAMIKFSFRPRGFGFRLRDLGTRTKISLIFLLLLAPVVYTIWTIVTDNRASMARSEQELNGSIYIATVRPALFAMANGKDTQISAAVETARKSQKRLGESRQLGVLADEFAFSASMAAVPGAASDASDGAMEKLTTLFARVAEESNLSVDPELDSFYLGSVIAVRLPALLGQLLAERNVAM